MLSLFLEEHIYITKFSWPVIEFCGGVHSLKYHLSINGCVSVKASGTQNALPQPPSKPYTNTRHQSLYKVFIKEKPGISISLFLLLGGVPLVIHGREALKNRKWQGRKRRDEWRRVKKTGGLGCGDRTESEEAGHFWRENLSIYIVDQTKNISGRLEECCRGKKGRWRMVGVQISGSETFWLTTVHHRIQRIPIWYNIKRTHTHTHTNYNILWYR